MIDICGFALDKEGTTKRFFDICDFYDIKNKDLINLFNISNATVSYWRNGTRFPDWDKLMLFAYTVGLPLDVIIIGKKTYDDEKIEKAINNILKLKQEKYICEIQKLLDNGKLNFQSMISDSFFNPVINNSKSIYFDTTSYNQLFADVIKYELEKNNSINKTENIFDMTNENPNQKNSRREAEIEFLSEFSEENSENLSTQNSSSLYIHMNGKDTKINDEYDNPLNGWRIDEVTYDNHGKTIILRFKNGYLDGDEFDESGKYLGARPAVETEGHIEYWRKGCLHRDGKQPAIITNGFRNFEFWKKGKRIK
jgi:transcriptional regulator with XRE-family HTH domain